MAKYLDQASTQHFAEALMSSTKTIGGQSIWGSGNIDAGGNGLILIESYEDFQANKSKLESLEYKSVLFNIDILDLQDQTITISNAFIIGVMDFDMFQFQNAKTLAFFNCMFVTTPGYDLSGCNAVFKEIDKLMFVNCSGVFESHELNNFGFTFDNIKDLRFMSSDIKIYNADRKYDASVHPNLQKCVWIYIQNSSIQGISVKGSSGYDNFTYFVQNHDTGNYRIGPFISNSCTCCDFSQCGKFCSAAEIVDGEPVSDNQIFNTDFKHCKLPDVTQSMITNVDCCVIPKGNTCYYFGLTFINQITEEHPFTSMTLTY